MKVWIVAGGTGGHLYPGIALAHALQGHEVRFVVRRGDLCREILEKEGFLVAEISGQGLPRTLSLKCFTFPVKFIRGWLESWILLRRDKPDHVVGMGGYLSFPMVLLAHLQGIPTLLHEQNVLPGLTNRWLSRWADSVAVSFEASLSYFPKGKAWVSGLPIRAAIGKGSRRSALEMWGLTPDIKTVLVFGGSLGARKLNSCAVEAWRELASRNVRFQVLHVTGAQDFLRVERLYADLQVPAKVMAYCHDMPAAYSVADAVICRAGASTIAELLVVGCPAFVVPYPYASDNHQWFNAQVLVDAGSATRCAETELSSTRIAEFVETTLKSGKTVSLHPKDSAKPKAVERLRNHVLSYIMPHHA